jgi:altronate dehydratase small subunit
MNDFNSIMIDTGDNVVTTLNFVKKGDEVRAIGLEAKVVVREDIISGHKVAVGNINKGDIVVKYGKKVGIALEDILVGDLVHIHNVRSDRGKELRGEGIDV